MTKEQNMNFVEYNDKKILYEIVRAKIKNMYMFLDMLLE